VKDPSRLVVVVGAGASSACGMPDTAQLTDQVVQLGTIVDSSMNYRVVRGGEPEQWESNREVWPMTPMLWEALKGSYARPNFETYIHALETLEPMAASRRVPNYFGDLDDYKPVVTAFTEVLGRYEPFMRSAILNAERLDVTRRIFETLDTSPDRLLYYPQLREARSAFARMFDDVFEAFDAVVLTLNYDDLIDQVVSDQFDGFLQPINGSDALQFERAPFVDRKSSLPKRSVLHLHGSVRFGYWVADGQISPQIVKFPNREAATASVAAAIKSFDANRGDAVYGGVVHGTTPIISGIQKADKLMLAPVPFGYYYHAAISQILGSNRLLVLGYGCRDPHINAWVYEAARIYGDTLRLAFVTYLAPEWRGPYTNTERHAIQSFLSPNESAAMSWGSSGPDVLNFGTVMVVRSGVPLSDDAWLAVKDFLAS
jgi:SIR2-like domain